MHKSDDDAREKQRLADWAEKLDEKLALEISESREFKSKIESTLYGDGRPLGDPGLIKEFEIMARRLHLWQRRVKYVIIIFGAVGAFIADISKDIIGEALKKRFWHDTVQEVQEKSGKDHIKSYHIRCTDSPMPLRRTVRETKKQIVEDIYIDRKIGEGECE
jgi:hypothetical protein